MIDVTALAQPIFDLLASFGTGVLATGGPTDSLRSASSSIEQVHALGRAGITAMNDSWDGQGADSATSKAHRVQTTAATVSDRGNEMATVVAQAAEHIKTGNAELDGIARSFVNTAAAAAPVLGTPAGMTMLVSSAIDHLGQAVGVVNRVQGELQTHTASMNELTPPPTTPSAVNTGAVASAGTQAISTVASGLTSVAGSAGSVLSSASSGGSSSGNSSKLMSGRGKSSDSSGSASRDGVKVTLPDGSVVEAPNEKAAKAVEAALGTLGTPYVWGGNQPGAGLDCSGMTQYAYGEAGVDIPRMAHEQANGATPVSEGDLMPGDLAVWDGHVAMVIGNGQLIEAGDPVQISSIRTENSGMEFMGFYRPTE